MLRLTDVRKAYTQPNGSRVTILDVGKLELGSGEQMVLVGRSGSGKTTLLHVIAGISRPDAGVVEVGGTNIAKLAEHQRDRFRAERIGYVFQTFNLLSGFSALENVMLGMSFVSGRSDPARAKALLERVGMGHRLANKPPMLSVGEQQRVAVARALANRPKLVLADEPTANVDAANQQQIVDLLRETCADEDVTLLLVTHEPDVSSQFERVEKLEDLNQPAATT